MVFGHIDIPIEKIRSFCRRRKITELALFGSVLRDDFGAESDIDILVTFTPDCAHSSFDLVEITNELSNILGRPVDLVERAALKNPFRKKTILDNMEVVYAA